MKKKKKKKKKRKPIEIESRNSIYEPVEVNIFFNVLETSAASRSITNS
jgi:hypothetical protein